MTFDASNVSFFAGSSGRVFAERICKFLGVPLGSSEVITFSEGNTFVRINETVRNRDCFLIQTIGLNANTEFVESMFWCDAMKRADAERVTMVMPYFSYAKGDKKDEPRVSIRARVCAESMELAGADRFIAMDLHAAQVQGFFKNPLDHLYAMPMLKEVINALKIDNAVIVSPDAGYAKDAHKFARALNLPIAIGDKTRVDHSENAELLNLIGDVEGKNCIVVDDFTISGGTLINLAKMLKKKGANHIIAMLSHNVISAKGVEKINNSPIEYVISTDTIDNPNIVGEPKFKTISVAPMFAETIRRSYTHESVKPLYEQLPEDLIQAGFDLAGFDINSIKLD